MNGLEQLFIKFQKPVRVPSDVDSEFLIMLEDRQRTLIGLVDLAETAFTSHAPGHFVHTTSMKALSKRLGLLRAKQSDLEVDLPTEPIRDHPQFRNERDGTRASEINLNAGADEDPPFGTSYDWQALAQRIEIALSRPQPPAAEGRLGTSTDADEGEPTRSSEAGIQPAGPIETDSHP